jgi:hypothetical protein
VGPLNLIGAAPDISASRQAIEREFDRLDLGHKGYLAARPGGLS